jgi:hypothetical protein
MQKVLQPLHCLVGESRSQSMGPRRAFLQHQESTGIEAMDHIEDGLSVAAQLAGYRWGSFASLGGQHDLAAA